MPLNVYLCGTEIVSVEEIEKWKTFSVFVSTGPVETRVEVREHIIKRYLIRNFVCLKF